MRCDSKLKVDEKYPSAILCTTCMPRSATAVAVADAAVSAVTEKQFIFAVEHSPYFALNVTRVLADRLRPYEPRHLNQLCQTHLFFWAIQAANR